MRRVPLETSGLYHVITEMAPSCFNLDTQYGFGDSSMVELVQIIRRAKAAAVNQEPYTNYSRQMGETRTRALIAAIQDRHYAALDGEYE